MRYSRWIPTAWRLTGLFVIAALVSACPSSIPVQAQGMTLRERLAGFRIGVHRGGSLHRDSNTLHRFEAARQAGADIIETDLRLTKDGIPIIIHDPTLDGSTNGSGRVEEKTLEEIKTLRVAGKYPIPTFEETLQWSAGRIIINAEFKTRDVIAPAIALVQQYSAHEWVYFQTKSDPERYFSARALDQKINLLYKPEDEASLKWALELDDENLVIIELGIGMDTPEIIERVHAAGKLASKNAWHYAVFDEFFDSAADRVFEKDIDIAITNRAAWGVVERERFNKTPARP